ICLGSPGTNDVSREVYKAEGLNQKYVHRFDERGNLVRTDPGESLVADQDWDYAALTKISKDGAIYFVCAGIDEEGTVTAVNYLVEKWEELWKKVGDKDFTLILKVDKKKAPRTEAATELGKTWLKDPGLPYFNPLTT
ncbi:MAG TPA: hypothetical protein VNH18_25405, partial [Bryobacteraceae bacterium]|nr:hypothetical protein [Bryobacteraceae bacterium]